MARHQSRLIFMLGMEGLVPVVAIIGVTFLSHQLKPGRLNRTGLYRMGLMICLLAGFYLKGLTISL